MIKLTDFSRLRKTDMVIVDGVETFGVWTQPSYLIARPDEQQIGKFKVANQYAGRPDLIANTLYGTPLLDWVLMAFNNVTELNWPSAGTIIEYPVDSLVFPEL